eukprot:895755-Rhodomonas_salina.1
MRKQDEEESRASERARQQATRRSSVRRLCLFMREFLENFKSLIHSFQVQESWRNRHTGARNAFLRFSPGIPTQRRREVAMPAQLHLIVGKLRLGCR